MQKKLKFFMIIFISLFLFCLIGASSAANTYNITDSSYSKYFNTTTGHISNSNVHAGDTLDLSGTIKNKNMYIDRPLTITSKVKTAQILNGTITILPGGSGSNVTNLKINNSNQDGIGIFLNGANDTTIKGNQIHCNGPTGFGMALTRSNHNNILGNTIMTTQRSDSKQTHTALVLGSSNYNTIEGNTVKSDGANCIYLSTYSGGLFQTDGPSYHNDIINNTVVGVDTPWCYSIQMSGSYNLAKNNKIVSQNYPEKASTYGIGAYVGISSQDDAEGGNSIIGNTISATYCGILAGSNCIISGNTITSYKDVNTKSYTDNTGITAGPNCNITNNNIKMTTGYGIDLTDSNCIVTGNKITTTSTYAIDTSQGTQNTITSNYLVADNNKKMGDTAVNRGTNNIVKNNTPATVTVTPVPGYYKNTIQVTLKINIPGTLYYTINGTTPTTKSTKYTKPISITKTTTLKFVTVDGSGNTSPVQSKTYTIDKVKPVISSIDPKNGAVNVPVTKTIKVTFKENIKKGSKFWIDLKNSAGKAVAFTATVSGKTLTIKPKSKLAESKYKLTIHTGAVTDLAGNPVAAKTTSFTAGTPPTIKTTSPKNGAKNIARSKAITLNFSENIKAKTYWIELKASNGSKIGIKKSIKGKILTITHTTKLKANTKYKLVIHTGAVTDKAGNPVATKTISFTTGKT